MNYKQMFLLEELINSTGRSREFKVTFIMDDVLCVGDFRRNQKDTIDSEKLLNDYLVYIDEGQSYFDDLRGHLEEIEVFKGEEFWHSVFNSMVVFLEERGSRVDDYLNDPKIPEFIYDLYVWNEYYERFSAEDAVMNPYGMYVVTAEEG